MDLPNPGKGSSASATLDLSLTMKRQKAMMEYIDEYCNVTLKGGQNHTRRIFKMFYDKEWAESKRSLYIAAIGMTIETFHVFRDGLKNTKRSTNKKRKPEL